MRAASWVFRIALFIPFAWLTYSFVSGAIGADPAKVMVHRMGQFTLYYLALNLVLGALIAYSFRFPKYLRFLLMNRRWLGVVTFVYLVFHLLLYLTLEGFEAKAYLQMVTKLYLILGTLAFLIMAALAFTSNNFSVRRLGIKRWKNLHRLVYFALILVTVHVMLIEKADLIFYGAFFTILWAIELPRLFLWRSRQKPKTAPVRG